MTTDISLKAGDRVRMRPNPRKRYRAVPEEEGVVVYTFPFGGGWRVHVACGNRRFTVHPAEVERIERTDHA
jgi:hypothetical protein